MEALSTTLRLRVVPGATRSGVVGRHGDAWKVRVSAPAEAGRANDAVLALLADVLGVVRREEHHGQVRRSAEVVGGLIAHLGRGVGES